MQKIHDPSKMIAEFYAAPHFQLHKKVRPRPDFRQHQHPTPPPPRSKDKRKMQSSGIDLDVKIFHIDVSLFVLTLTARRRNYLFKNFLLYLRCGRAVLLLRIRLAMWMFIRSKELKLNKHGRAELYCHCAVSFVLLLVKPRMIAK